MNLTPNKLQQALVFSYVIVIALTAGMNLVPLIDINRALLPQYQGGLPDFLLRFGLIVVLLALVPFAQSLTYLLQFSSVTTANFIQLILPNYMWLSLNEEMLEQTKSSHGSFVRQGSVANAPAWRKVTARVILYMSMFSMFFGTLNLTGFI